MMPDPKRVSLVGWLQIQPCSRTKCRGGRWGRARGFTPPCAAGWASGFSWDGDLAPRPSPLPSHHSPDMRTPADHVGQPALLETSNRGFWRFQLVVTATNAPHRRTTPRKGMPTTRRGYLGGGGAEQPAASPCSASQRVFTPKR